MSERTFNVSGVVLVENGEITSVEKGNVEKPIAVASRVCAFSMKVEGSALPVKIILKGQTAVDIWNSELKDGKSVCAAGRATRVNVAAELREVREKEFVIHNPSTFEFFKARSYKVG